MEFDTPAGGQISVLWIASHIGPATEFLHAIKEDEGVLLNGHSKDSRWSRSHQEGKPESRNQQSSQQSIPLHERASVTDCGATVSG